MRRVIFVLLAVILPLIIYWAYVRFMNWKKQIPHSQRTAWWVSAPWPWLALCMLGLLGLFLFSLALFNPAPKSGHYEAAIYKDGQIIKGHILTAPVQAPAPDAPLAPQPEVPPPPTQTLPASPP